MLNKLYKSPLNIVIYLLTLLFLLLGCFFSTNVFVYITVFIFFVWDIFFLNSKTSFSNRDYKELSQQIVNVRNYASYFLPFYGLVFGILLAVNSENREQFFNLFNSAGMPTWLLISPFVIASIAILFIPIQLSEEESLKPTKALKSLFIFSVFCQQASIFLFIHILIRIISVSF